MHDSRELDLATEALVGVSAAVAARRPEELERALRMAAAVADPSAVDEVLLQSHLFVGFPIALEAMRAWRSIASRPAPPDPDAVDPATWPARGAEVCRTVYADNYDKLRANVAAMHPAFDRWMVEGGYGRVIGRPGLELRTRELCIAALLAVWDAPRQLHSHLRGALNAGASIGEVAAAVEIAGRLLEPARLEELTRVWDKVNGTGRV